MGTTDDNTCTKPEANQMTMIRNSANVILEPRIATMNPFVFARLMEALFSTPFWPPSSNTGASMYRDVSVTAASKPTKQAGKNATGGRAKATKRITRMGSQANDRKKIQGNNNDMAMIFPGN